MSISKTFLIIVLVFQIFYNSLTIKIQNSEKDPTQSWTQQQIVDGKTDNHEKSPEQFISGPQQFGDGKTDNHDKSPEQFISGPQQLGDKSSDSSPISPDQILAATNSKADAITDQGDAVGLAKSDSFAVNKHPTSWSQDSSPVAVAGSETNSITQDGNAVAAALSSAESSNKQYDFEGNEIDEPLPTPPPNPNWFNTGLKATDVGVSSEGDTYAVHDGMLYYYEFNLNRWTKVVADYELKGIVRVDVNYDGTPYVVTLTGEIYFLSCYNTWVRLPGCATDIGAGRGGEVFKTGCKSKENGHAVYRLFCECKCECKFRSCKRYRTNCNGNKGQGSGGPSCYWFKIEGEGVKIDVSPNGWPYVTSKCGNVLSYNGLRWRQIGNIKANDLSISNEGTLYVVADDNNIYKSINESNGTFKHVPGDNLDFTNISVGPYSLPSATVKRCNLYTTAKAEFN